MRFIKLSILLVGFSLYSLAYAIAPVEDAYNDADNRSASTNSNQRSSNNSATMNLASFSLEQRTAILEHQISNLNPLLVQMDDLNQQMQALRGRIEEQQHRLQLLEEQVRSQYQALDKRLTQRQDSAPDSLPIKSKSSLPIQTQGSALERSNAAKYSASNRTPVSSTSLPTAAGERAYQTAFQFLKNKQYATATESFEVFIKKYPADINQANANYFLGQLYLLQGQPEQSITRFNHFVTHYPLDARIPDALLQLGLAYFAKGEKASAIDIFKKIIQQYPDSKAAQSAQARLQQFQAMISSANMRSKNNA